MSGRAFKDWLVWYLRQPFRLIVWFMETFAKNRERVGAFLARGRVAAVFKTAVILTFALWIGIFAFLASKDEGDRFSCAVKSLWPGSKAADGCAPQPWQQPVDQNPNASSQ